MNRFSKLFALSWRGRRLLLYACLLLNGIRLALWLFPFGVVRQQVTTLSSIWVCNSASQAIPINFIVWAVAVAGRYTPGKAMCLVRALTAQILLNRYGYSHQLHIGVARSTTQELEAHAWIEYEGRVVIGGLSDLSRFKPLSAAGVKR
ncbi:MAG: lasso peptide biosynthesis B2 protein [Cyanobacteria bacterium J06635_15]